MSPLVTVLVAFRAVLRNKMRSFLTTLGIKAKDVYEDNLSQWPGMKHFRKALFSRIVPTLKDIGLFGPRMKKCFTDMGVFDYTEISLDTLSKNDEDVALELDKLRTKRAQYVNEVIAIGAGTANE